MSKGPDSNSEQNKPSGIVLSTDHIFFSISSPNKAVNDQDIDPITKAVRERILAEQLKILKEEYANHGKKDDIKDASEEEFKKYLTTREGREEVYEISNRLEIKNRLNNIEVNGYKSVHTEFSSSFRDVDWSKLESSAGVRSFEVKNDSGELLANLKETTHNQKSVSLKLDNGTEVQVQSYRSIDFPIGIEGGKGPMHLSMAVKDAKGENIAEEKALYFTAHYDKTGKLVEISSPQPIKFSGLDKDAVAYVERDNQVYTLAVTRGKYMEMMQEVSKNQGMAISLQDPNPSLNHNENNLQSGPPKTKTEGAELKGSAPQALGVSELQSGSPKTKTEGAELKGSAAHIVANNPESGGNYFDPTKLVGAASDLRDKLNSMRKALEKAPEKQSSDHEKITKATEELSKKSLSSEEFKKFKKENGLNDEDLEKIYYQLKEKGSNLTPQSKIEDQGKALRLAKNMDGIYKTLPADVKNSLGGNKAHEKNLDQVRSGQNSHVANLLKSTRGSVNLR